MKEEPELIGLNLIPVDVKSDSGDDEIGQSVFYKMHINALINSSALIPDVQPSVIITLLVEDPVQIHQICPNLWTWFPITKDLFSANDRVQK